MSAIGAFTRAERRIVSLVVVTVLLTMPGVAVANGLGLEQRGTLLLEPCPIHEVGGEMLCGSYEVFESPTLFVTAPR